ncbi:hypothetical protein TRM7557_00717 [Tritonibacter multivorans]|uniref:Uncharacterized protein n=1 Tax=Tritonibacter multivorans TaxID=928856 RepID=A0A0P1G331_9RHOB|nr:hypothetical protein [Tritonibacter multivorans]MDA7419753.1 hypothetical protein [Tritonibacter multivorans]CUH76107.1 hypothetical protein TRM7557_00717 [Tritonibacter multivorans]SFC55192.1 hypothetical protein SAMN04488049_10365 [Tritonibacter multivorans]
MSREILSAILAAFLAGILLSPVTMPTAGGANALVAATAGPLRAL